MIEKLMIEGRCVWGHPARDKPKVNYTNKQPVMKDGKQVICWEFGIAVPKAKFDAEIWPLLWAEASRLYPQGPGRDFSWKITDGDGFDKDNKPYNTREGYAGNRIVNISTQAFAPPIYKFENGAYRKVEANEVKCGDWFAVEVNVQAHNEKDGGLYINPNMLQIIGYDKEIVSTSADPMATFGGRQFQLPPGVSTTPISSAPPASMPQAPQQGYAAPQAPGGYPAAPQAPQQQQYAPQAPMAPQAPLPPPAPDFVQNAGMPPAPQQQYAQPGFTPPAAPAAAGHYPPPMNSAPGYAGQPVMQSHSNVPGMPPPPTR